MTASTLGGPPAAGSVVARAPQPARTEPSPKRVRVYLGGRVVADTLRVLLVWEVRGYPTFCFPAGDVDHDLLVPDSETPHAASRGARTFTVRAGNSVAPGAAQFYGDTAAGELSNHVRFEWDAMDAWFEEDEEVYTHARDPHTRIDVLATSRRARVELGGVVLAESASSRLLFETGLPPRCYIPAPHVRMDLLVPSGTVTRCPYKGTARYWSAQIGGRLHPDIAWSYPAPLPESQKVAGLIAFWKADITIDGIPMD